MGNEHSKNKELTKNGKIPDRHENGSVNGVSATITLDGLEIEVKDEPIVQQNGGSHSLNVSSESSGTGYVVVETDSQPADVAPVISEIPEIVSQKEEVNKSKEKGHLFAKMFKKKAEPPAEVESVKEKEPSSEDQTDVSLPATDPQPESGSSGDEAAATVIAEHSEDSECPHRQAEIWTQTDRKMEADISTQTGDADDDTVANTEGPVDEEAAVVTEEDPVDEAAVVIAQEVVEETADDQTGGSIIEEVVIIEKSVYENIMFRAERVEVTDKFEQQEASMNETGPDVAAESNPNKSIAEREIAAEENRVEETVPLEICSSLPKLVADCVAAVFTAVSETIDFAAAKTVEQNMDKIITEDNCEETRDVSADMIETAEPEANAVTPEDGKANGIPSLDEEPVTTVMETISEVVCEEPNPAPATRDIPVEELSAPLVTEIIIKVESAQEELTTDDEPGISHDFVIVEAPSNELITSEGHPENTVRSPNNEVKPESTPEVSVEALSNALITIEELPEDTLSPPDHEVKPAFIPEVIVKDPSSKLITTDELPEDTSRIADGEFKSESIPEIIVEDLSGDLIATKKPPEDTVITLNGEVKPEAIPEVIVEDLSGELITTEELLEDISRTADGEFKTESIPEVIVEDLFGELITFEELPEDTLSSADDDVSSESIPEVTVVGPSSGLITTKKPPEDTVITPNGEVKPEAIPEVTVEAPANEFFTSAELPELSLSSSDDDIMFESIPEVIVEGPSNELITTEELPEDTSRTADGEFKPESIPEVVVEDLSCKLITIEELPEDTLRSADDDVKPESIPEVTVVGPSNELITTEKFPGLTLCSADDDVKPESIPKIIEDMITEVREYVIAEMRPETVDEAESRAAVIIDAAEETSEAAFDSLFLEFELSAITPLLPALDNLIPVEEEVITATSFVPLFSDANLTIPEEPSETVGEEMTEEAIDAVSNETEAEPADEEADVPQMEAAGESESCVLVQEEPIEENSSPADVLLEDAEEQPAAPSAVEAPTDSNPVIGEETVEESTRLFEPQVLVVILKETEVTEAITPQTRNSEAASADAKDSQIDTLDEPVAKCAEAVLETIIEETIAEDLASACNLLTSDEVAAELIAEAETEEKAEDKSSENSTDSTESVAMTRTDMEALLVRLQSTCISVVKESAYRLGNIQMSSLGYSITITIHVAIEDEQQ